MRKISITLFSFLIAACSPAIAPLPAWTAFATGTPNIVTATPLAPLSATPLIFTLPFTPTPATATPSITATDTAQATSSPFQAVTIDILGCDTSLDVLHGMGEVTNAYVTVKNIGTTDLPNACALLRAIDEDREHPDKKACVPNLPVQNQTTFKLTVDTAYKQDTIIQVDALSNDTVILRVDQQACKNISLFGGAPGDVGIIKPIP
ncbi:MAG: hypothetical protein IT310_12970 [Anaerolineales bacterium]|nr:hypothetical protein [Anaerolineales bacterium]